MATYYVENNGTGTGGSITSPTTFGNVWGFLSPGDTVIALGDGATYQGAANMLNPTEGLNGFSNAPITVKALNDGGVTIDGQFVADRAPIRLSNNSYWIIEGFNAKHGHRSVVGVYNGSTFNVIRRVVAWDAYFNGECEVLGIHNSTDNRIEDVALFGMGRKIADSTQEGNRTTFRRVWARTDGSGEIGHSTFDFAYNNYDSTYENCIATIDQRYMPTDYEVTNGGNGATGIMQSNSELYNHWFMLATPSSVPESTCVNSQVVGSFSYIIDSALLSNTSLPSAWPMNFFTNHGMRCFTLKHCGAFIHPSNAAFNSVRGWLFNISTSGSPLNLVAEHISSLRGNSDFITPGWSVTDLQSASSLGDLVNQGADPWTGTSGAQFCYRWENGVQTTTPLWPWPMNDRIRAATGGAGVYSGPCLNCSGGLAARTITDVTAEVQTVLGIIPAQCLSGATPPPPDPPPPPPPPPPPAVAPVADFSGTPLAGAYPLTVTFTDGSTNTPTSWAWTFGDAGTSTLQNVTHIYSTCGVYDVSLTATNSAGSDIETKLGYINVTAPIPRVKHGNRGGGRGKGRSK